MVGPEGLEDEPKPSSELEEWQNLSFAMMLRFSKRVSSCNVLACFFPRLHRCRPRSLKLDLPPLEIIGSFVIDSALNDQV